MKSEKTLVKIWFIKKSNLILSEYDFTKSQSSKQTTVRSYTELDCDIIIRLLSNPIPITVNPEFPMTILMLHEDF